MLLSGNSPQIAALGQAIGVDQSNQTRKLSVPLDADVRANPNHSSNRFNRPIKAFCFQSYLEIGVQTGQTSLQIATAELTGVDRESTTCTPINERTATSAMP